MGKIKTAAAHLKPVIKLAAKDATIVVAACMLGEITSQEDNLTYNDTKKQFVKLIISGISFKQEFEEALKADTTQTAFDISKKFISDMFSRL